MNSMGITLAIQKSTINLNMNIKMDITIHHLHNQHKILGNYIDKLTFHVI